MCTFNTLLLPASVTLDRVNAISRETLRRPLALQGNASIEAAVGLDARSFVRATGHCDCGTGLLAVEWGTAAGVPSRKIERRRAEGWSEAKIERWIADQARTRPKREAEHERVRKSMRADQAAWAQLLGRVLDDRLAPWVGLFIHDYHGSIETERVTCNAVERRAGVTAGQLCELATDTAYVFTRAR